MSNHEYVPSREPWEEPPDEWFARTYDPPALDRLTHLVLVDGRLVDLWTESVRGTRWQSFADRFDDERRPVPVAPPDPPEPPAYERALAWLRSLVGGAEALASLDEKPLVGAPTVSDGLPLPARRRWEETQSLTDTVAGSVLDDEEIRAALRVALALTWRSQPSIVTSAKSAAHLAAGLLCVVGKANGLFSPVGPHTQREVAEALGLKGSLGQRAPGLESALVGFRERGCRPYQLPDLMALGEARLLTSGTRRDILRWRDRALSAQQEAGAAAADDVTP
jgi:hypothetical protein